MKFTVIFNVFAKLFTGLVHLDRVVRCNKLKKPKAKSSSRSTSQHKALRVRMLYDVTTISRIFSDNFPKAF